MRKKILVVDDEPHIRKSLELRLKEAGFQVDLVPGGQEALVAFEHSLQEKPYDLILLDIIMPGMSGLEVLESIRKNEKQRKVAADETVPVIMLTALRGAWREDALEEGCDDFIVKPYDGRELVEAVKRKIR